MVEKVARSIAYEHCNRKQWVGHCSKEERCEYYAEHEWKTFIPDARAAVDAFRKAARDSLTDAICEHIESDSLHMSTYGTWLRALDEICDAALAQGE